MVLFVLLAYIHVYVASIAAIKAAAAVWPWAL
jgi:hypothetical protein